MVADSPFALALSGSFGRTMDDLILLDSIVRPENCTTSVVGALPEPISCVPNITRDLNLTGLRLGLPSTFGWAQGISSEVHPAFNHRAIKHTYKKV